ncbi:MAG: hypothetical protein Q4E89_01785 [Eubacteriales bacterium]|nr:hypothetical protein [Eubacteriales bacterium]
MAVRPVFVTYNQPPYYRQCDIEFAYSGGFSVSQKQKNIQAIHNTFHQCFKGQRILEISSKSLQKGGKEMSAFFLKKKVPSMGISLPVENIFQAGKVFEHGGPYLDLLLVSPKDAKRDERLRSSGSLIKFTFENQDFPLKPRTAFYDYLYIHALLENPNLAGEAVSYDAFTDIEFNPQKSLNCQARAAAVFVSVAKAGLLDEVTDFNRFLNLLAPNSTFASCPSSAPVKKQNPPKPKGHAFYVSDTINHKKWGHGTIRAVRSDALEIEFSVGMKTLSSTWMERNCTYASPSSPGSSSLSDIWAKRNP